MKTKAAALLIIKRSVTAALGLMVLTNLANAGPKIGNGGGAWVCRESGGSIRWSKLVDLFEATDEFGLNLNLHPGTSRMEIVDQVQSRIAQADRDLSNAIAPILHDLDCLKSNPPKVTYTSHLLQTIDDSLYRIKPSPSDCVGGVVGYEQVVNYKNDGLILIDTEVFNSFDPNSQAALILHEAIYKYRRDVAGDTDSVTTRRLVGLIFSTISSSGLKTQLEALGERDIGDLGMKFSLIQASTFMMGSSPKEFPMTIPFGNEPQHQVTLTQPFEIQTTPVTQSQYARVMGVNPSFFAQQKYCEKTYEVRDKIAMCPDNPVENVTYSDVQAFISKFSGMHPDEYVYRLPTGAEWEYAARGGTNTVYFFGDDYYGKDNDLYSKYVWTNAKGGWQTHEVAQLKPNSFGLYDMFGNVSHWMADWYDDYAVSAVTDPKGPSEGTLKELRPGGCIQNGYLGTAYWNKDASTSRSSSRWYSYPENRQYCAGFRLVRVPRN